MAKSELKVKVCLPWWMPIYIRTLAMLCLLMNTEPDEARVKDFIHRHIKLKIIRE